MKWLVKPTTYQNSSSTMIFSSSGGMNDYSSWYGSFNVPDSNSKSESSDSSNYNSGLSSSNFNSANSMNSNTNFGEMTTMAVNYESDKARLQ
ncbi:hypothetical protein [Mycoplasma bradburyae]|uniref:hypothetical protein n=1 Tax=Mycoplasma bradburyae TaxID=2963128 RepID=UPI0023416534|nr:hypothetical protein [Mycoplasma bradburyae]MDC4182798.1 hypothetical protein [Mycoplasma bradburyae]